MFEENPHIRNLALQNTYGSQHQRHTEQRGVLAASTTKADGRHMASSLKTGIRSKWLKHVVCDMDMAEWFLLEADSAADPCPVIL